MANQYIFFTNKTPFNNFNRVTLFQIQKKENPTIYVYIIITICQIYSITYQSYMSVTSQ